MDAYIDDRAASSHPPTPLSGTCSTGPIRKVAQWALFGFFAVPAVLFFVIGGGQVVGGGEEVARALVRAQARDQGQERAEAG